MPQKGLGTGNLQRGIGGGFAGPCLVRRPALPSRRRRPPRHHSHHTRCAEMPRHVIKQCAYMIQRDIERETDITFHLPHITYHMSHVVSWIMRHTSYIMSAQSDPVICAWAVHRGSLSSHRCIAAYRFTSLHCQSYAETSGELPARAGPPSPAPAAAAAAAPRLRVRRGPVRRPRLLGGQRAVRSHGLGLLGRVSDQA